MPVASYRCISVHDLQIRAECSTPQGHCRVYSCTGSGRRSHADRTSCLRCSFGRSRGPHSAAAQSRDCQARIHASGLDCHHASHPPQAGGRALWPQDHWAHARPGGTLLSPDATGHSTRGGSPLQVSGSLAACSVCSQQSQGERTECAPRTHPTQGSDCGVGAPPPSAASRIAASGASGRLRGPAACWPSARIFEQSRQSLGCCFAPACSCPSDCTSWTHRYHRPSTGTGRHQPTDAVFFQRSQQARPLTSAVPDSVCSTRSLGRRPMPRRGDLVDYANAAVDSRHQDAHPRHPASVLQKPHFKESLPPLRLCLPPFRMVLCSRWLPSTPPRPPLACRWGTPEITRARCEPKSAELHH